MWHVQFIIVLFKLMIDSNLSSQIYRNGCNCRSLDLQTVFYMRNININYLEVFRIRKMLASWIRIQGIKYEPKTAKKLFYSLTPSYRLKRNEKKNQKKSVNLKEMTWIWIWIRIRIRIRIKIKWILSTAF